MGGWAGGCGKGRLQEGDREVCGQHSLCRTTTQLHPSKKVNQHSRHCPLEALELLLQILVNSGQLRPVEEPNLQVKDLLWLCHKVLLAVMKSSGGSRTTAKW